MYTLTNKVTPGGTRHISLHVVYHELVSQSLSEDTTHAHGIIRITRWAAEALGLKTDGNGSIKTDDSEWGLVYMLSQALFGDVHALTMWTL